jgi:hypothetical protein
LEKKNKRFEPCQKQELNVLSVATTRLSIGWFKREELMNPQHNSSVAPNVEQRGEKMPRVMTTDL